MGADRSRKEVGWPMKNLLLLALAGILGGCVTPPQLPNGFAMFYQDQTQNMRPEIRQRLLPPSGSPQIEAVPLTQIRDEERRYAARGLLQIGAASFSGPPGTREQALEQAQKVGAEFVILGGEYSHTAQAVMPSLSVQPGQTYTTQERGTVSANTLQGGFGYGSYSGSATTTTPPTFQTQYTPYSIPIYSQVASFWRRAKPAIFGAYYAPIPDDVRVKLQRNTGVYVTTVVEGSPAFRANIMLGDVIVQFASKPVETVQDFMEMIPAYAGQKVSLAIVREGKPITLEVQLNEAPTTP
jgi:PDZ domain-containing protein